jgi:hypothetical protein
VKTISDLYYAERNHRSIGIHKMKLFQAFVRNRYGIYTNVVDDQIIEKISLISQVPESEVREIFNMFKWIEKNIEVSDDDFIRFYQTLNSFYKKCK